MSPDFSPPDFSGRGSLCVARVRVIPPDRVFDDSLTVQARPGAVSLTDETALHTVVLPPAQARAIGQALLDAARLAEEWAPPADDRPPAEGGVLANGRALAPGGAP